MALLELTNITAGYDKNVILKNLNLQVEKGELLSLLGSSGCGKTTTLRLIAGFSSPMEGTFSSTEKIIRICLCTSAISVLCFRAMPSFPICRSMTTWPSALKCGDAILPA